MKIRTVVTVVLAGCFLYVLLYLYLAQIVMM